MTSRADSFEKRLSLRGSEPTFNDDRVDLTQIRRALEMTPLERLADADEIASEIDLLRRLARPVNPSGKP